MSQRVLIVDFTSSFGGAFEHALALTHYLTEKAHDVVGLVSAQESSIICDRVPSSASVFSIEPYRKLTVDCLPGALGRACSVAKDIIIGEFPRTLRLNKIFSEFRPTVVHLNNLINIQQSGVLVSYLRNVPCVFCHQDFEYRSRLALVATKYVDRHVAISYAMRDHLLELGVPQEKIEVIHHGVDTDRFSPSVGARDLRAQFSIPQGRSLVALFGRVVDWKGPEIFLRAIAEAIKTNQNIQGLLVGDSSDGDPEYMNELRELTQNLGIESHITFTGYTADTAIYMNSVDIVVHASTRPEPFGLVVTEAMACQKPVIASAEGGPLDIVVDGETGRLVRPRDPIALSAAILEALSSQERLKLWGEASRKRVIEKFSLDVCGRRYAELYSRLAASTQNGK